MEQEVNWNLPFHSGMKENWAVGLEGHEESDPRAQALAPASSDLTLLLTTLRPSPHLLTRQWGLSLPHHSGIVSTQAAPPARCPVQGLEHHQTVSVVTVIIAFPWGKSEPGWKHTVLLVLAHYCLLCKVDRVT